MTKPKKTCKLNLRYPAYPCLQVQYQHPIHPHTWFHSTEIEAIMLIIVITIQFSATQNHHFIVIKKPVTNCWLCMCFNDKKRKKERNGV